MKNKHSIIKNLWSIALFVAAILFGANGVVMASAITTDLPDAGTTTKGNEGGLTETLGRTENPDMYLADIDQRIVKIRPMTTPIDNISRYAKTQTTDSFEVKFYSVGTRPIKTTLSAAVTAQTSGTTASIDVADAGVFDESDTIRVVGVKGYIDGNSAKASAEDLMLYVSGANENTGQPVVCAVNGIKATDGQTTWLPAIPKDTVLIRLGKSCAELDVQTAAFANIPTAEIQYCQNFMMQVEQSTFDKIAKKEVNWGFSDLEEDCIYDMRVGQEGSYLFGVKGKIKHPKKKQQNTWFTGGLWWMAGKDLTIGHYESTSNEAVISDDDLVDFAKEAFTGTGTGNKQKILFCGSELLASLGKTTSEKFRLKETTESWHLKFKTFDTDFGEILAIHHEFLDQNGMSKNGFLLDPTFLTKRVHKSFERNVLDLKSAGIRNTDAVVLQEVCCLYLRYAKAHARVKLATA